MLLTIRTAPRETQGRSLANYLCVYHIIRSTIVKSLYSNLHMRPSRQLSLLLCIKKCVWSTLFISRNFSLETLVLYHLHFERDDTPANLEQFLILLR